MRTHLIRIGNSKGIRIPKPILVQVGLEDEVELSVREGALVIRPGGQPRDGWVEAFEAMARKGDDGLLLPELDRVVQDWDEKEWEWT
ncbi:MAG: AbrB/MazE/SpoVT family DNA-binding domain-containing protein [Acidobacteria bacterium]|nr:AbrB/MazE/SpoVT family DNA-binding domain-containing protein [Acidobacteriota bacterium]